MEKLPAGTSVADFEQALIAQLVALENILKEQHPDLLTLAESARRAMDTYLTGREQALQTIANGVALSLEYTNNHPLDEPGTSDFRFVLSLKPSQYVTLTANAAASIYNSLPSGTHVSLYRDAQAALQLDLSLSQWGSLGSPVLSAAGYYQYMHDPALITIGSGNLAPDTNIQLPGTASVLLGQKGNIGIAQIKFTLPFKKTGVTFPVAVTWANRTDLVKGSSLGAHVGISFDLDHSWQRSSSLGGLNMFGSSILDIAIGLCFVYLLLSLVCSAAREVMEGWMRHRAADLKDAIDQLLDNAVTGLSDHVYGHGLVKALYTSGARPSYIPAQTFALALMDTLSPGTASVPGGSANAMTTTTPLPPVAAGLRKGAAAVTSAPVSAAILALIDSAGLDATAIRNNIERGLTPPWSVSLASISGERKTLSSCWDLRSFVLLTWIQSALPKACRMTPLCVTH